MRRLTIIKYLGMLMLMLLVCQACIKRVDRSSEEQAEPQSSQPLDPLADAIDREVIPEVYPIYVSSGLAFGDSLVEPGDISFNTFDSTKSLITPTEVYRVQIFTSRLYEEARREKKLADEIFNLPVYLDYEVPYYKLRIGDFITRDEAEGMIPETRSIGYRGAWVARVVLRIRSGPDIEDLEEPVLPLDETDTVYISPPNPNGNESEGNR